METLFDRADKKVKQQIAGDRLRTEKVKKEDVAILHDQRNGRKMQMSTLDHESREKWQNIKESKLKISK